MGSQVVLTDTGRIRTFMHIHMLTTIMVIITTMIIRTTRSPRRRERLCWAKLSCAAIRTLGMTVRSAISCNRI